VRGLAKSPREANCGSIVSEKGISDGVLKTLLKTTGKRFLKAYYLLKMKA
jgi:hypothetical protein